MDKLKEKLSSALGTFGMILYYILTLIYAFLPVWIVSDVYVKSGFLRFIIPSLLYLFCCFFPALGGTICEILWIWGLILVFKHFKPFVIVIYSIFFAFAVFRFITVLLSDRERRRS